MHAQFPKIKLEKAGKLLVRECDETEKGMYVAYVDEGAESYDVSLTVLANQEISHHSCDCPKGKSFCSHTLALMLHIANPAPSRTVKAKTKQKPFESLLDDADEKTLKVWVRSVLVKNRDLEMAFVHHFSPDEKIFSPEEVMKLTNEAVKAVIKKQRVVEASQVKKIVELWESIHEPIINQYLKNVTDETAFLNFHAAIEACWQLHLEGRTNSTRITKYLQSLLDKITGVLAEVFDSEQWWKAIQYFARAIVEKTFRVRMHYVKLLVNVLRVSERERKEQVLDLLAETYKEAVKKNFHPDEFTKILFQAGEEVQLTGKYLDIFRPIRYDNGFNIDLILLLINNGKLTRAEKYCLEQIKANVQRDFDEPYLILLKRIYLEKNEKTKLAEVISRLLPLNWDFNDYIWMQSQLREEEKKQVRNSVFARAAASAKNGDPSAIAFCYNLLSVEGKFKKMIEIINDYTSGRIIVKYFPQMVAADPKALLIKLVGWNDFPFYVVDGLEEENKDALPELAQMLISSYHPSMIKAAIQSCYKYSYRRPNQLSEMLMQQLNIEIAR